MRKQKREDWDGGCFFLLAISEDFPRCGFSGGQEMSEKAGGDCRKDSSGTRDGLHAGLRQRPQVCNPRDETSLCESK